MSTAETFPTFIKIAKTSRDSVPPYALVAISETVDDARYLIMRLARFVISFVFFAAMLLSLFMAFVTPIIWVVWRQVPENQIVWWRYPAAIHPWMAFFGFAAGVAVCFALFVAIATPYRYTSNKPGLDVRTCGSCGVQGPNNWFCGNCNGFRYVKVFSSIIWLLGLFLTLFTVTFDGIVIICGMKR